MDSADRVQAAWARAAEGRALSADLSRLMPSVCAEIERRPTDLRALQGRLKALLVFLGSPEGRTDPNCRAVDLFFCMPEEFGWDVGWSHLPESVQNILGDLSGTLHDAVTHPEIAENSESTPEQLLGRVRGIPL